MTPLETREGCQTTGRGDLGVSNHHDETSKTTGGKTQPISPIY